MNHQKKQIWKIELDGVRGGETFLFGAISISKIDGDSSDRIIVSNSLGKEIKKFSFEDILKMKKMTVDSVEIFDFNLSGVD